MGNFRTAQNTFLGGILDESALGRTETDAYKGGASVLDNCIPSMSGSLKRMPPMTLTYPQAMLSINVGGVQTYTEGMTLFGFFQGRYLVSRRLVTPDYANGIYSHLFSVAPNGTYANITYLYPTAGSLGRMLNQFISSNTPDLRNTIQITLGDVSIFFSEEFPPHVLVKSASGVLYLGPWDAVCGTGGIAELTGLAGATQTWAMYPYMDPSTDGSNLTPCSSRTILEGKTRNGSALFTRAAAYYTGRYVKINNGANTSVFFVTGKISDTQLSVTYILGTVVDDTAYDDYAFSYYGARIYPTSACFFQGRLVFGGFGMQGGYDTSIIQTPKIFASRSGNIFTFMQDRLLQSIDRATDKTNGNVFLFGDRTDEWAVVAGIATADYESTSFVQSGTNNIFVGTTGGLFSITGNQGGALTPTSISLNKISEVRCEPVYPAFIDGSLFFAGTDGELLFTRYSDEQGGNVISYATALCRQFKRITALCYDEDVDALFVSGIQPADDRRYIGVVSFSRTSNTISWSLYNPQLIGDTEANTLFRSVYYIPRNGRSIYISVKGNSTAGEATGLAKNLGTLYSNINADFLFTALKDYESNTIQVPFFEGQSVKVYKKFVSGDTVNTITFEYVGTYFVSGGVITVPDMYLEIEATVALASEQIFESLPLVDGGNVGSADMARKRIDRVFLRVRNATPDIMIGTTDGGLAPLFGNEKVSPYSGIVEVSLLGGQSDDVRVRIENRGPYSFELISMVARGITFD